jgi:peptidoglycan/LPS O-acetylase OafA/YrhL
MHGPAVRIPSLDGLRAISVALVVISHLLWHPDFIAIRAIYAKWFAPLGGLGVRVFFVISGFLITSLLVRELATHNRINLAKFYFRRTLRIFPPYYFYVAAIFIAVAIGWIQLPPGDMLHALTYTVNYNIERSSYLGHAWSLSVEEQFYLLWPAVLLIAGKRYGLYTALLVMAICPVVRVFFRHFTALPPYELAYRFETIADSLAAGCTLAILYDWLNLQQLYHRILRSRLFILVPIIIYFASLLPMRSRYLLFGFTLQNLGIAACIAWAIKYSNSKTGMLLNSRPMVFIGVMSYSIYLWQQPFLSPDSTSVVSRYPLNLLFIAAASLISYYCLECPALGIRQWLEPRIFVSGRKHAIEDTRDRISDNTIALRSAPSLGVPQTDADGTA